MSGFRSSNAVKLRTTTRKWKIPEDLSEDVKDQLWQYFRLSNKCRVYGFLLQNTFHVIRIDPNHKISDKK